MSTHAMAAEKTANRCHAGAVETGWDRGKPDAKRERERRRAFQKQTGCDHCFAPSAFGWPVWKRPLRTGGVPLDGAIFRLEDELPGELVGPRDTGEPARAAEDRSGHVVLGGCALAFQLTEHLVALLIRPDSSANQTRFTVHERDDVRAESDTGAPRACQQHRPSQINDRAPALPAERNGPAIAGGVPGTFELPRFARCRRGGFGRLRRRPTSRRREGQGDHRGTSQRARKGNAVAVDGTLCEHLSQTLQVLART